MDIQDFKRWHWIVISLMVGACLAYARTMIAPDEQGGGRGISAVEFAGNINRQKTGNGFAWVTDLTIYPPTILPDPTTKQDRAINFVQCSLLTPLPNGKHKYKPVHLNAEVPFEIGKNKAPSENYTILNYLDDLKKDNPAVQYRFAWWAQPKTQFAMWMGGSVLLIGGLWPSLISLMVGAGLGGAKKEKDAYDLDRFSKSPEPARKTAPAQKAGLSTADQDQLRQMGDRLEQNLATSGLRMTGATIPGEAASAAGAFASQPPQIRKLDAGPVESVAIATDSNDPKEYGGEYYPVAKPLHAPHDPPAKAK